MFGVFAFFVMWCGVSFRLQFNKSVIALVLVLFEVIIVIVINAAALVITAPAVLKVAPVPAIVVVVIIIVRCCIRTALGKGLVRIIVGVVVLGV
jgi:hypothetical protein